MSNYPRRSARLSPQMQQNQFQQKPNTLSAPAFTQSYSQSSSTSTSSHPSPISNTLNPPPPPPTSHQPPPGLQLQPSFMSQPQQTPHLHAPLPSPSLGNMEPFFGRLQPQTHMYASQDTQASFLGQQRQQALAVQEQSYNKQAQQQYQAPQQYDYQQRQLHPHTNSMSQEHPSHAALANPGQLPPNFLAEAAKRAELACLMRDFGDVSL
ncbi:uncharacterized protein A1O9_08959 [Exophiala aquamarina CBS 119918]|uniref:Uncharacterized protein n=1 Tax=Exophiala aquamarina CBS 119918 TaxID=1182545 RepID=A0A072PII7_9EURO|nr:uncharacterized protein A1O9_08959 [Exophiala aquamarina CBS 119918]KEF55305.1 hypothetical protein A1O9_08959 [Exophiala aquamarina CBS 119918]